MSIKNKLQIYLITYNRKQKLQKTFEQIFAEDSPIKNFDITILDNASTDGSSELIEEYCQKFPNITHIRHNVNIGGNANICRAFEMATYCGKEYCWILCDDDKYDFSNWSEVEKEINAQKDIICVSNYICNTLDKKSDVIYQIFQLTFVPAGIYKISNITNNVLMNMYDSIITMMQQACISIKCVNENKKIHVLSKPIVFNGLHFEDKVDDESLSYTRGANENINLERRNNTNWALGYSQVLSLLNDKKLAQNCFIESVADENIYTKKSSFYYDVIDKYLKFKNLNYFYEIFKILSVKNKFEIIILAILSPFLIFYSSPKGIYVRLFGCLKTKIWSKKPKNK